MENGNGKLIPDDPDFDGTDAAHPAFWRGHDHGCWGTIERIKQVVDGKDDGRGVMGTIALEDIRRRLLAQRVLIRQLQSALIIARHELEWASQFTPVRTTNGENWRIIQQ